MRKIINSGLRRHRPKKKFRFEYIKGKYSGLKKKDREFIHWFSEIEREEDAFKWMQSVLKNYWKHKEACPNNS